MIEELLPFCECGKCDLRVTKPGNRFILGHVARGRKCSPEHIANRVKSLKENKGKPKPIAKLCKCGCGDYALPGNDYINEHHLIGRVCSEETKDKTSKTMTGRTYSPERCAAILEVSRREREPLPDDWKLDGNSGIVTNRDCGAYLGIFIAEHILSKVFKYVQRMPLGNHGFDFICNRDYKIDVKSSATGYQGSWYFNIKKNEIADYFVCLAFEDRKYFTPNHLWLIPGNIINHLIGLKISKTTLNKWDKYEQPLDRVIICCDFMKNVH